ncbi:2908_t:CDS:1, partial [Scutellospora calospora]
ANEVRRKLNRLAGEDSYNSQNQFLSASNIQANPLILHQYPSNISEEF